MTDTDSGTVRRARPRYQVFLSSTWNDLKDIRAKVTWEVLKAGHIPAGMENFPATDDRGWDIIRRTIDRSDYYLIMVGGRYGTYDPNIDMSWTHREYEYARSKGMPVLAFIRERASVLSTELDEEEADRKRLAAFIETLSQNHLKQSWTTPDDLATKVVHALRSHIDNDEESGKPRLGWYRGDQIPSGMAVEEFARLSAENTELKALVASLSATKGESLSVLTRAGSPPQDELWEYRKIEVTDLGKNNYVSMTGVLSTIGDTTRLAERRSKTWWLELSLRNTGAKAARGLVVDITVDGTSEIVVHRFGYEGNRFSDPGEHCYLEYYRQEGRRSSVRQRIRQVGVGHTEDLVRVGFTFENVTLPLSITCSARSEDGVSWEGSWSVRAKKGAILPMTERELYG